ncbi:hypothetical protein A2U01_0017426, partial [Trifolium medium]|nr:hypothetical protein [Trifolium medium]
CLPLVSDGEIASTFDNLGSVKLGHCGFIEEMQIMAAIYYLLGLQLLTGS